MCNSGVYLIAIYKSVRDWYFSLQLRSFTAAILSKQFARAIILQLIPEGTDHHQRRWVCVHPTDRGYFHKPDKEITQMHPRFQGYWWWLVCIIYVVTWSGQEPSLLYLSSEVRRWSSRLPMKTTDLWSFCTLIVVWTFQIVWSTSRKRLSFSKLRRALFVRDGKIWIPMCSQWQSATLGFKYWWIYRSAR